MRKLVTVYKGFRVYQLGRGVPLTMSGTAQTGGGSDRASDGPINLVNE